MTSAFEDLANAVNELVVARNTDHQAEEEQQIVLAQTPEPLAEEINKIESKFEQVQIILEEHRPVHTEEISQKLDAAFEELYDIATFVGGDPDDRQTALDERFLETELVSVMADLKEAKAESDRAWEALCAARDMVSLGRKTR
jgi:hypothetical protein